MSASDPFRWAFVTGATPDKWARAWRERSRVRLELVPVEEAHQLDGLRDATLDAALVRTPVEREGLHLIPLYDEVVVVVASREHFVAAADEVTIADLAEEQLVAPHSSRWRPETTQLAWPQMSAAEAIETVAAGTGIVLVPASVARLQARRDVVAVPVVDLAPTSVGLAWRTDNDDPRVQTLVGVVRGRTANSSRG